MEKQLDLGFCNLVCSDNDNDCDFERDALIEAYNSNKEFSGIEIPRFNVRFVYSREEFEKLWGSETEDYVSAFARDDDIVIFAYGVFDKETRWEKDKFKGTLIHEVNHLFYQELRDDSYDPLWLSEGLATFMQHGKKKFNYKDKLKITKEALMVDFEDMDMNSYQIFTMFTEYLISEFGVDKILRLIEGLKNGGKLNDIFQKIYMRSFDELIKDGNRYHEVA